MSASGSIMAMVRRLSAPVGLPVMLTTGLIATMASHGCHNSVSTTQEQVGAMAQGGDNPYAPTWDQSKPPTPNREGFGLLIGQSSAAEVRKRITAWGLTCADASPAVIAREARKARTAHAAAQHKAEGAKPDAVSSASAHSNKPSKYESIEQVRISCEQVTSAQLGDWSRASAQGRMLFVFDSQRHPVRHVSYQRTHRDQAHALGDMLKLLAHYRERLGQPNVIRHELPERMDADYRFPLLSNVVREWQFGDFRVKLAALLGSTGNVVIYENVEVPAGVSMNTL